MNEQSHIHQARKHTSCKWWAITMLALTFAMVAAGVLVAAPHFQAAHAAGATLTVVPKSASYSAQTGIVVKGQHFAAGETVNIYWNYTGPGTGTLLATASGDPNGSFIGKITIPTGTIPGSLTITGVGQNSSTTASFPLVVYQPTFTLAPLSGSSGTLLTMTAYGFQKNEKLNIFW